MFRLALILLMLLQPFQWAWANVYTTADAAYSVSHSAMEALDLASESLTSFSAPDDGVKSGVYSGINSGVNGHTCNDNNFLHTTVLGLGGEVDALLLPGLHAVLAHSQLAAFDSVWIGSIERPKWFATR